MILQFEPRYRGFYGGLLGPFSFILLYSPILRLRQKYLLIAKAAQPFFFITTKDEQLN